ncbi:AAA family ATPase [Rhodoblastus sp.]|uniref:AAA family ATPase n=1 Tax=Rhodoblastus sp. TaxID=1962975 RepID=UPI002611F408|nr:AAA family ATPase [Rhodoblastus sp.]
MIVLDTDEARPLPEGLRQGFCAEQAPEAETPNLSAARSLIALGYTAAPLDATGAPIHGGRFAREVETVGDFWGNLWPEAGIGLPLDENNLFGVQIAGNDWRDRLELLTGCYPLGAPVATIEGPSGATMLYPTGGEFVESQQGYFGLLRDPCVNVLGADAILPIPASAAAFLPSCADLDSRPIPPESFFDALAMRAPIVANRQMAPVALPVVHWDSAADAEARRVEYLVKGLFGKTGVSLVAGQAGSGKSAVVLDLAVAVATSGEGQWLGHKLKATGGTLWLAGEALGLMGSRLDAIRAAKLAGRNFINPDTGKEIDINALPIAWAEATNLADPRQFEAAAALAMRTKAEMLEKLGAELRLIVIDSVVSAFGFAEDPDAAKASAAMKALAKLSQDTGALCIAIHHYGKTADAGVYGTYSWTAMSDSILAVLADKDPLGNVRSRQIALKRTKTGSEEGWSAGFTLRPVSLGVDEDGDEITAPVIEAVADVPREVSIPRGPRLSQAGKVFCDALASIIAEHGQSAAPFGSDGPTVRAVDREKVRAEFYARWPADGDTPAKQAEARRKRFAAGERNAIDRHRVQVRDLNSVAWVWPLNNDATLADSIERRG